MRLGAISVGVLFSLGCSSGSGSQGDERIHASWRPRAGDVFTIKMQTFQEGSGAGTVMLTGDLRIQEVGPDGRGRGTFQIVRLELRRKDEASPAVLYEGGALKAWKEGTPPELDKLSKPLPIMLEPSGKLESELGALSWNPVPFDALGVWLPAKIVSPGESWTGKVRAAYSDWVEVEYSFAEVRGGRVRVVGRSTPKAEEKHKILIRSEGSFLRGEGYVSDALIDIDFSPLGSDVRRKVSYEIRRR